MKDMERSLSRTEWREAATGGLYAGLAYALLTIAAHAGRSMPGLVTILNAVSFFSFAGFLYFYARRMAAYAGGDGFSYGRSLLFVLKMSLFAGVLAGVGQFVLVNWIDPEGFRDLLVEKANLPGVVADTYPISSYPEAELPTKDMVDPVLDWMKGKEYLQADVAYDSETGDLKTK